MLRDGGGDTMSLLDVAPLASHERRIILHPKKDQRGNRL